MAGSGMEINKMLRYEDKMPRGTNKRQRGSATVVQLVATQKYEALCGQVSVKFTIEISGETSKI